MNDGFEIAGRLTLGLEGLGEDECRAIARQLDPYPAVGFRPDSDVLVAADPSGPGPLLDIQRDAGDGRLTATDGARFFVLEQGRACAIPPLGDTPPARFEAEPGFPVARAFRRLVRPTIQVCLHDRGCVAVHSAAVEIDGRAVLVAGWSESGKTETALALIENGARFLSDKWTIVGEDCVASAFPIGVGVRGWTLRYLPRLNEALGWRPRGRLRAAAATRTVARPFARRGAAGPVERVVTLADRVAVSPSELRRLYGHDPVGPWQAPLSCVAILTTVPAADGVDTERSDPAWAAARLALSASYERRGIFELHDRARWALRDRDTDVRSSLVERERNLLEGILRSVPIISVRAPFPTDPRPVAEAIVRHL